MLFAWLTARRPSTLTAALRSRFLWYFAVLLVAWTPWLVLTWPGAMRDDTLAQYLQAAGIHHYYTQHPLFDTLIFGLFWRLGDALGSPLIGEGIYTAAQVLAFAAGASLVLCHIRKLGAPRWLRMIGLVYLATSYVVVGSIATMGKDSLHTVFFLPMAAIFVETCLTRGRVLARTPVAVAFTLLVFAVVASKRTALVIMVCAGIGLLVVCRGGARRHDAADRRKPGRSGRSTASVAARHRPLICLVAGVVLAQGVFAPIATAATHANVSPGREVWGLVTQPVAQVAHDDPDAVTPAQRQALDAIMDLDKAVRDLNPHRTNETFETLRLGAGKSSASAVRAAAGDGSASPTAAEKLTVLKVWAQLGLTHPAEYVKAYAGVTRGWWDPRENFAYPTDSDYLLKPGYLRQWATFLPPEAGIPRECGACDADTIQALRIKEISADLKPLMGTSDRPWWKRTALRAIRERVRPQIKHPRWNNPLTAMALYVTWIPLAVGVMLMGETVAGNRRIGCGRPSDGAPGPRLAAYGLLAFTVLSLYASPEALFWYPIPVFLSLPLFTALPFLGGRTGTEPNGPLTASDVC